MTTTNTPKLLSREEIEAIRSDYESEYAPLEQHILPLLAHIEAMKDK